MHRLSQHPRRFADVNRTVRVCGHAHFCGPQDGLEIEASFHAGRSGRAGHILGTRLCRPALAGHFARPHFGANCARLWLMCWSGVGKRGALDARFRGSFFTGLVSSVQRLLVAIHSSVELRSASARLPFPCPCVGFQFSSTPLTNSSLRFQALCCCLSSFLCCRPCHISPRSSALCVDGVFT